MGGILCGQNLFQWKNNTNWYWNAARVGFLMADETRVQVLKEPERRAQSQSCMWLVRSGEDGLPPIILFGYTETKAKYHIERFLEGYGGRYLETDGYQGYNNLNEYYGAAEPPVRCGEVLPHILVFIH